MLAYPSLTQAFITWDSCPQPSSPCSRTQNSHGLGEEACHLLTALIVAPTHPTLVEFLLGAQVPITASLDALALDTDRGGVRSTRCTIHHLQWPQWGRKGERGSLARCLSRDFLSALVSCPTPTHLRRQHIEVASAIGSADELALVPGRNAGVLGHPCHGKGKPVGAVVIAIESLTLLLPEALAGS